jgi:hypothetical protein
MPPDSTTPADYGLSQKSVAALLCCNRRTIERYLTSGKLREYGSFTRRKVSAASVAEFLGKGQTAEEIRDLAGKEE